MKPGKWENLGELATFSFCVPVEISRIRGYSEELWNLLWSIFQITFFYLNSYFSGSRYYRKFLQLGYLSLALKLPGFAINNCLSYRAIQFWNSIFLYPYEKLFTARVSISTSPQNLSLNRLKKLKISNFNRILNFGTWFPLIQTTNHVLKFKYSWTHRSLSIYHPLSVSSPKRRG